MTWRCVLHSIPEDKLEELLEYCRRAQREDVTFKFRREGKYVIIQCPTRNSCFRRGVLFHSRFQCYFECEVEKK